MATLAEIRAKLLEQETRRGPGTGTGDNAIYTFWNIPENTKKAILEIMLKYQCCSNILFT